MDQFVKLLLQEHDLSASDVVVVPDNVYGGMHRQSLCCDRTRRPGAKTATSDNKNRNITSPKTTVMARAMDDFVMLLLQEHHISASDVVLVPDNAKNGMHIESLSCSRRKPNVNATSGIMSRKRAVSHHGILCKPSAACAARSP